jgi:ankyrin repeat protein
MNPNYINEPDALVWATHYAVEEEFFHCLDRGDDLNVQDEHGRTPLHAAAEEGWANYAAILIERGADIHQVDKDGDTPLDYAVFHEHHEIASLLRSRGARVCDGRSAKQQLEDAAHEGFASANAVKRLALTMEEQRGQE